MKYKLSVLKMLKWSMPEKDDQPPVSHGESESQNTVPSGELKVPTGGPENTTLLVKPENYLATLGNAHQNVSMKEHEQDTKPSGTKKEEK